MKTMLRKTWFAILCAALSAVPLLALAVGAPEPVAAAASGPHWVGTWATAPQPAFAGTPTTYRNQTLRLIVHASLGGPRLRIRVSNTFGDAPLLIGAAHVGRRRTGADIDPASDHAVTFDGHAAITLAPHATVVSDAVELGLAPLSDLAVSLFLPQATLATTEHALAQQTSWVADDAGDRTAAAHWPKATAVDSWPFLTGVDVEAAPVACAVVAFGDSTIDGDGSTPDTNRRWPDLLAARLQAAGGRAAQVGVLNQGLIGNRLLYDSPAGSKFGAGFGPSALARFDRDVLQQPGAHWVIVRTGTNDIGFAGGLAPRTEAATAQDLIAGYRRLIARAHAGGLRIVATTLPPFENGAPVPHYYAPAKEAVRQQVNEWLRGTQEFDAVLDFDRVLRDPAHPARLQARYDSGDHLHPNDAGYAALAAAVPLTLFDAGR